jgi:hypothetical protein
MPLIKLNDRSIKDVTSLPFGVGTLVHIQSQTASNSASISFTTGINSTYKEYQFYFIDIHPRTDNVTFNFNLSTDSGSNYNVTKTSTFFRMFQDEAGTDYGLGYQGAFDLAQSTSYQPITNGLGNGADENGGGYMSLFNPASTTYVKHFIATTNVYEQSNYSMAGYTAGYGNTTSAINAVRFQMSSGNFDGTIAMFGVL